MRGVASGVLAGVVLAAAVVGPHGAGSPTRAQPAPGSAAPDGGDDVARAKDLYKSAEAAMTDARYADAIRDYGAAYEITKDAVLFYKIGSAHERLGKCDVALIYYRRYLKEGQPSESFVRSTQERIAACGGTIDLVPDQGSASATDPGAGSGGSGSAAGSGEPVPKQPGAGSASALASPGAPAPVLGRHRGAWLLIGGSIAFLTLGSVLAYSADAAENDVDDLYIGLNGTPPAFDARTRQRYDDAVAEGQRYQTLSLISFGVAGALAVGAAVWFVVDRTRGEGPGTVRVTPSVTPGGGGVAATLRF
jgi:tetratricopeptide (TPR) repeat protein